MKEQIKAILLNTIIGDALGTPLNGLGKAHIKATLKAINDYTDPAPALKGKMDRWKKPALYSSISQFMLLLALSHCQKGSLIHNFKKNIASSPEIGENKFGIFRYPGITEQNFLSSLQKEPGEYIQNSSPCSGIIPILTPLAAANRPGFSKQDLETAISIITAFTSDLSTITGAFLFLALIKKLQAAGECSPWHIIDLALEAKNQVREVLESHPGIIFDSGLNPETTIETLNRYGNILKNISTETDTNKAEVIIYSDVNKTLKTPVTRATINNPLALIPFSIYLAGKYGENPDSALFKIASQGGETAALTAMAGAVIAGLSGPEPVPEALITNLVNRKKLLSTIEAIVEQKISGNLVNNFIQTESTLTIKNFEELAAKTKHKKTKQKGKKSRKDNISDLSNHVVESWTKLDKAKWKKEKAKKDMSPEDLE
ncbi:MAG: hypothetical protein GY754_04650 [bacterium]|nr:hypothetical protein [bacterium]